MHLSGRIAFSQGIFTTAGPKPENEDALGISVPEPALLPTKGVAACIADGVSAASAGREAAETAVLGFLSDYFETPESWEVKTAGHRVLSALNRWLYAQGQGHRHAENGYLTTFTALIFKSRTAHVFHIGDSRLYRLRGGDLEQITRDHSTRVAAGTEYLTRALGLGLTPRIDYHTLALESGDRFLLSTDGIHGEITHDSIRDHLTAGDDLQANANALGDASANGHDNRSCITLRVDSLPDGDMDDVFRNLVALPFPPDLAPGQSIDGLEVDSIIAASKNSQLYLVRDLNDNQRPYVLKAPSVLFDDDPSYLERFAIEEWIGLRMNHPRLAKVIRRPRDFLYYLMEPVEGVTLTRWAADNPQPIVEQVVTIVSQIVDGVRALHRRDTLHQDLKPDNILVAPDGSVKIIDFGSCRVGGIAETASPFQRHTALGTLDFSAPEYRLGVTPGTRADQFSIALICYFLLTGGKSPFGSGWEKAKSARDFLQLQYRPAALANPMVPPWIDNLLRKSLATVPDARPESMSEFVRFLRQPDPEFLHRESRPFAERNPLLFWKLLAAAAALGWLLTWLLLR